MVPFVSQSNGFQCGMPGWLGLPVRAKLIQASLIRAAEDRVHLCDFFYSLKHRRWPRAGNPLKVARAAWFILRQDRHVNKGVSAETLEAWLQRR